MEKGMTEKITRNSTDIVMSDGSMATKRQIVIKTKSSTASQRAKGHTRREKQKGKANHIMKPLEVVGALMARRKDGVNGDRRRVRGKA